MQERPKSRPKLTPSGTRLFRALERYKDRWNSKKQSELAQQLREFTHALVEPRSDGRRKLGSNGSRWPVPGEAEDDPHHLPSPNRRL
jgi:hypothetical protein